MKSLLLRLWKKIRHTLFLICVVLAVCIGLYLLLDLVILPAQDYNEAVHLIKSGKTKYALTLLEDLGSFGDSKDLLCETRYRLAEKCKNEGDFQEAYKLYSLTTGYKDTDQILSTDQNIIAAGNALRETYAEALHHPGSITSFGTYPQRKRGNDRTPIEWFVLDVQGDQALLITREAIDNQPYHHTFTPINWADCSLRNWLNTTFLEQAFNEAEQQALIPTQLMNDASTSIYPTQGSNPTTDRVFLLSYEEAWRYFESDEVRKCNATSYTNAHHAFIATNGHCSWWLRSPGLSDTSACCVGGYGYYDYCNVSASEKAIRPAIWVNIPAVEELIRAGIIALK